VLKNHNLPAAFAEPFILFAVFAVLSIVFWLYFQRHPSPENEAKDGPVPPGDAVQEGPAVTSQNSPAREGDVAEAEAATGLGPQQPVPPDPQIDSVGVGRG
jgi:hypothetical protein